MPWKDSQAVKHSRKANTPARKRQWRKIANAVLEKTGDDAKAIRIANSAVKKSTRKKVSRKRVSK